VNKILVGKSDDKRTTEGLGVENWTMLENVS